MRKHYLVIWQQKNDIKHTMINTPVDIIVNEINTAKVIYERIITEIQSQIGCYYDDIIITGIYPL